MYYSEHVEVRGQFSGVTSLSTMWFLEMDPNQVMNLSNKLVDPLSYLASAVVAFLVRLSY